VDVCNIVKVYFAQGSLFHTGDLAQQEHGDDHVVKSSTEWKHQRHLQRRRDRTHLQHSKLPFTTSV